MNRMFLRELIRRSAMQCAILVCVVVTSSACADEPAVEAVDFQSRLVYRAEREPHYAAWVSFFPGESGTWYIGCEEVSRPDPPLPQASPAAIYGMALPIGYDKSQYLMEAVLLESNDDLQSWRVVSREPYRHHHSVHQFGSARTRDGRFLRFNWACYDLDPNVKTNEMLRISQDGGQTWEPAPTFVPDRFAYYPHRLRTLRDGTLVLCLPMGHRWGPDDDYPNRTAINLNTINDLRMTLYFSFDDGRTWDGPLPILDGQNVSETDFVELPAGDLLVINNSIFSRPGRQFIYRDGKRFVPGPLEFVRSGSVPETVCLTDGVLVGCMRPGSYAWSDDLGETWQPLSGVGGADEVYQPWMHALPDGRIVCAGHKGYDDPIGVGRTSENTIHLHTFRLKVHRRTESTRLRIARDFDKAHRQWRNSYTLRLTQDDAPLAAKELEVWYVERYQPGYDSYNSQSLEKRIQAGGTLIRATTDDDGVAHVQLPAKYDQTTDPHLSYQLIARFNANRADPAYKPSQTPQLEYYARARMDDELPGGK
ncbi:MAG: exo-alpha-sialidase [Planctomycetaceae bacterium]|nr:exo-alpha-sialidase [Planctomycetaceae bacterium]